MDSFPRLLSRVNVALACSQAIAPAFLFKGPSGGGALAVAISVPTDLQPAPFAFVIWGAIYLGSLGYAVWVATGGRWARPYFPVVGSLTAVGFSASVLWQVVAMSGPVWATLPAILLMACPITTAFVIAARSPDRVVRGHDLFVVAPLGLYAAWLLAATGVNLAEVLDEAGRPLGPTGLLMVLAAVASAAILLARSTRAIAFVAAAAWAFAGVAAAGWSRGSSDLLAISAVAAVMLLLAASLPGALTRLREAA